MARLDIRAKVRDYKDKDGNTKAVYARIGSAWTDDSGKLTGITIEIIPLNWDGRAFVSDLDIEEAA